MVLWFCAGICFKIQLQGFYFGGCVRFSLKGLIQWCFLISWSHIFGQKGCGRSTNSESLPDTGTTFVPLGKVLLVKSPQNQTMSHFGFGVMGHRLTINSVWWCLLWGLAWTSDHILWISASLWRLCEKSLAPDLILRIQSFARRLCVSVDLLKHHVHVAIHFPVLSGFLGIKMNANYFSKCFFGCLALMIP